jgi:hypothetical protein
VASDGSFPAMTSVSVILDQIAKSHPVAQHLATSTERIAFMKEQDAERRAAMVASKRMTPHPWAEPPPRAPPPVAVSTEVAPPPSADAADCGSVNDSFPVDPEPIATTVEPMAAAEVISHPSADSADCGGVNDSFPVDPEPIAAAVVSRGATPRTQTHSRHHRTNGANGVMAHLLASARARARASK